MLLSHVQKLTAVDEDVGKEAAACTQACLEICKAFLGAQEVEHCLRAMRVSSQGDKDAKAAKQEADAERKKQAKQRQVLPPDPPALLIWSSTARNCSSIPSS